MNSPSSTTSIASRYETLEKLGQNEFATTYLASSASGVERVVVKVPVERLLESSSFAYQLERATLEMIRVKHPHIVRVLDAGRADGVPYVVCEYVPGESLAKRLLSHKKGQTPTEVYAWLVDTAEALDFIHAKKVVHGEVRPSHIMFAEDNSARLSDYAFAAALGTLDTKSRRALRPDQPGFTAPEVVGGEPPMPSSDQWSLGASVYLALTGEHVVEDRSAMQTILRTRLTEEATEDLMRALSPAPAARFPSCYEFARAFGLERKRMRPENTQIVDALPTVEPALPVEPDALATPATLDLGEALGTGRWWRLRQGLRDQYARLARDGGFVAAGWQELGELQELQAPRDPTVLADLIQRFERTYGVSGLQARIGAGQVWRFLAELERGSFVVVPNPDEGLLYIGRIEGEATWTQHPTDGCRLPRRRPVTWLQDVPFASIPVSLRGALGGATAIVGLDRQRQLLRGLISPVAADRLDADRESALLDRIVSALYAKSIDEFQQFLRGFFTALGYDAELLPGSTDEIWEAAGVLAAQGLADTMLRTWVHRSRRDLDVAVVWETRGALAADEHGAVLSLGSFTDRAHFEACAEGKKCIRLVDGRALAGLVLEHWERLPDEIRDGLGVRRVERATIEVRFEAEE